MELVLRSEDIDTTWLRRRRANQKSCKPSEISAMGEECFLIFLAAGERNVLWESNVGTSSFVAMDVPTFHPLQIGEVDTMFHDMIS